MPRIVNMQMRRGRLERFIITLDDEQELIMTPEIVLKYGITQDRTFSDKEFMHILEEDALRQAKDQAMRFLSNRQHSRLELFRKLRDKGFRTEIIDRTIDRLEEIDLINDQQFAKLYIQNELQLRPAGRTLLSQKLSRRGIPREIYEPLLDEYVSQEIELKIALNISEKFVRIHSHLKGKILKDKMIRYLQGKGFRWEQIEIILNDKKQRFE